tara:strand:- start:16249 stop:16989 length:741 start_codon:yes stop_codon:yes gene_type:complete
VKKNKNILITGGSSGIGLDLVKSLSNRNWSFHFTVRNDFKVLKKITDGMSFKGSSEFYKGDLNDDNFLQKLSNELPVIDYFIFSAGILEIQPIKFLDRKLINKTLDINLYSPILLTSNLLKNKKISKSGSIVFISSIAGNFFFAPGYSMYSISKAAINSFSKSLAIELASQKIRVNSILPGTVSTRMTKNINILNDSSINKHNSKYPLGIGKPKDIAGLIDFLLSKKSNWITGSSFVIDGGYTINK